MSTETSPSTLTTRVEATSSSGAERDREKALSFLMQGVSKELEEMKQRSRTTAVTTVHHPFPRSSLQFLVSLPGNSHCVDCGASNPQWASISYGILVCLTCSGRHRSFGVSHSIVRSLQMDTWENPAHILCLLEGGNGQWERFLQRHNMDGQQMSPDRVYQTRAALFYRENMLRHVKKVS